MTQSEWSATKLGECSVFFDGDDCAGGLIRDAAIAEIARLRLTDEEREAISRVAQFISALGHLGMLLERTK
jgi:hypothetical protein